MSHPKTGRISRKRLDLELKSHSYLNSTYNHRVKRSTFLIPRNPNDSIKSEDEVFTEALLAMRAMRKHNRPISPVKIKPIDSDTICGLIKERFYASPKKDHVDKYDDLGRTEEDNHKLNSISQNCKVYLANGTVNKPITNLSWPLDYLPSQAGNHKSIVSWKIMPRYRGISCRRRCSKIQKSKLRKVCKTESMNSVDINKTDESEHTMSDMATPVISLNFPNCTKPQEVTFSSMKCENSNRNPSLGIMNSTSDDKTQSNSNESPLSSEQNSAETHTIREDLNAGKSLQLDDSNSAESAGLICRICHGGLSLTPELGELVSACSCRGTVGAQHVHCLERWLTESGNTRCELCGFKYSTRRIHRYGVIPSLFAWAFSKNPKQVLADAVGILMMSPMAVLAALLVTRTLAALMAPDMSNSLANWPLATTFVIALFTLVCYYCWVISAMMRHAVGWWTWYCTQYDVKLMLPTS